MSENLTLAMLALAPVSNARRHLLWPASRAT
jgi:hypothetical protein